MIIQSVDRALGIVSLFGSNREEMIPRLAAVGTPVFSGKRRLAGVIDVSHSSKILLGESCEAFAQQLLCTASEITPAMGYYLSTDYRQAGSPVWLRPPLGKPAPRATDPIAGVRDYSKRV